MRPYGLADVGAPLMAPLLRMGIECRGAINGALVAYGD